MNLPEPIFTTTEGVTWMPTGRLRIIRRWFRRDRLQQEVIASNLSETSDRIAGWWDVYVTTDKRS